MKLLTQILLIIFMFGILFCPFCGKKLVVPDRDFSFKGEYRCKCLHCMKRFYLSKDDYEFYEFL